MSVAVSWVGLSCVIVIFPDHTHLLFDEMKMSLMEMLNRTGP